jgi:hypothetical protein
LVRAVRAPLYTHYSKKEYAILRGVYSARGRRFSQENVIFSIDSIAIHSFAFAAAADGGGIFILPFARAPIIQIHPPEPHHNNHVPQRGSQKSEGMDVVRGEWRGLDVSSHPFLTYNVAGGLLHFIIISLTPNQVDIKIIRASVLEIYTHIWSFPGSRYYNHTNRRVWSGVLMKREKNCSLTLTSD